MTLKTTLRAVATVILATVATAMSFTTSAQTSDHDTIDDSQWHYRVTPYAWGAGLDGTVGKFGRRADVDKSFSDVFKDLDAGAMAAFEARRGRLGLLADFMYVSLSESDHVHVMPGLSVDAKVKVRANTFMFAAQYRAAAEDWGYVDLIGGARHWSLRTNVDVSLGHLFEVDGSDTESWTDPVLGVKGTYHLGPRSYLTGWAIAGGFGAGSRFSSDLMGAFGYKLNNQTALLLGYRHFAVDYKESGFVFDAALHGPALGLDYRF